MSCDVIYERISIYFTSLSAIRVLAQSLHDLLTEVEEDEQKLRHNFLVLLEVSLWGNKCDLSISAGSAQSFADKPLEQVRTLFGLQCNVDYLLRSEKKSDLIFSALI